MADIGRIVAKLRFTAGPVERVYLNAESVSTHFTGSFGTISNWVVSLSKGGKAGLAIPLVTAGANLETTNQITLDIANPLAQALILATALRDDQRLRDPLTARDGDYVLVTGAGCVRHPEVRPSGNWHPDKRCEPTEALEQRRADSEQFHRAFGDQARVWLLTVQTPAGNAVATTDSRWLDDRSIPRFFHRDWTLFGTLEDKIDGIPVVAPISVLMPVGGSAD
jgi:hypothetical protein